jgi:small-conductance mechanosensitive channel
MHPLEWLDSEILGSSAAAWIASFTLALLVYVALTSVRLVVHKRLQRFAGADAPPALRIARQLVARTSTLFLLLVALLVGSELVESTPLVDKLTQRVAAIVVLLQVGLWATTALSTFMSLRRERQLAEDPGAVAALDLVGFVLRLVVWVGVLLVMLDNLGVNITALVAGLGVGGIAVALAAQNILGDLFASLSIVLDKPFVVGDFLAIGEFLGSVENVGLKTTRMRSLSGEQVVFANADLLKSRIRNYGRMFERRVVFSLGVTYQTTAAQLKSIPVIVRTAIEAQPSVRFDRAHFQAFGSSALEFEIVYFVLSPDYNLYMDIQQNINFAIYERFAAAGIEFAYPTHTVFVAGAVPTPA